MRVSVRLWRAGLLGGRDVSRLAGQTEPRPVLREAVGELAGGAAPLARQVGPLHAAVLQLVVAARVVGDDGDAARVAVGAVRADSCSCSRRAAAVWLAVMSLATIVYSACVIARTSSQKLAAVCSPAIQSSFETTIS